jgi:lipoic acid synthetase
MLGLGEQEEEVYQTMRDLREANVDVVTIGQYLQPKKTPSSKRIYNPEQFAKYEQYGLELGFVM